MSLRPVPLRWLTLLGGVSLMLLTLIPTAGAVTDDDGTIQGDPAKAGVGSETEARPSTGDADSEAMGGVSAHILPEVRLTPRRVEIAGLEDSRQYLHGTWGYVGAVPEGFDGQADRVEGWQDLEVPGHPVLQGYEAMPEAIGAGRMGYRYGFEVPAAWEGRRVILRFEDVDGLSKVWINGRKAGENDIATLPSEYDVTDLLSFGGANELTMTVEKSLVTLWSRRELGGINREVYLQALPTVNLARLHVDTTLAPGHGSATVNAHVKVANQGDRPAVGVRLRPRLTDASGQAVELSLPEDQDVLLPTIAAGQTLELTVPLGVRGPELWTAESPTLYELSCELLLDDEPQMTAQQRFGFRDIAVRGHELMVNGRPVKLRGTNYHITYPGQGEIVSRQQIQRDVDLFLDANFNCLRSRPTPSIDYVEVCDESGMYTTIEAMITLMIYAKGPDGDHGANPAIAAPLRHHLATMIESYYSNPSVITWGLGNECPYYDYFKVAAVGMHAADPSRPLFFGSDARLGIGIPFMDINDDHYPRGRHKDPQPFALLDMDTLQIVADDGQWTYPDDRPTIFTEWLHVHTNNWKEVAYDPGIDDIWGYYAKAHLDHLYKTPHFTGGFQFKGAPYRGIGASERWRGVFDGDRRINDLHWHVKKSHSPVRIEQTAGTFDAQTRTVRFEVENRHDFTDLDQLELSWTHGRASGRATAHVAPHETGVLEIQTDGDPSEPIRLSVISPAGRELDRYELTVNGESPTAEDKDAAGEAAGDVRDQPWRVDENSERILLTRGDRQVTVDPGSGLIVGARIGDRVVLDGAVTASVVPTQQRNFKLQQKLTLVNQLVDWQAERVEARQSEGVVQIAAQGRYTHAGGRFVTSFAPDGRITVACDLTWDGPQDFNLFTSGITFAVSPELDVLSWRRDALWSAYPEDHIGRARGQAPARGDPRYADLRDQTPTGPTPWPWSQDMTSGVTQDFRATRYRLIEGGLFDGDGLGIRLLGQGVQHLQAVPAGDDLGGEIFVEELHGKPRPGFDLTLMNFHNGGTEPHMTKSLRMPEQIVKKGWRLQTEAAFRLVAP